jgi:hypothetical protein
VRIREFPSQGLETPANCRRFATSKISVWSIVELSAATFPKVSKQQKENSRFLETQTGDRRIKPLPRGLAVGMWEFESRQLELAVEMFGLNAAIVSDKRALIDHFLRAINY